MSVLDATINYFGVKQYILLEELNFKSDVFMELKKNCATICDAVMWCWCMLTFFKAVLVLIQK